ncbi:demethylmenaquinone methyltransferase [Antribacter gilvus]|uniref:demethylmenaquinone methyltransferase n=1 Tax=Antribacter gilvus TaxID=2304675 RepID=UPI000F7A35BC|nr:demethylmenaquinone methyltransferase [Antribacter gilvus]
MSRASLEKKPAEVASMFDGIARRYDLTNDLISLGQDRRWRRLTVDAVAAMPGERVLDLAAGTGTSSEPFADGGAYVVPSDFSIGMLRVGKERRPDLPFVAGDATSLPFADASFDAATISFGLRNVVDTSAALREMLRVVRPGGRIVIAEFSTPTWVPFRMAYHEGFLRVLPVLARTVSTDRGSYEYLTESIRSWPDQEALARLMLGAGWERVAYRNVSGGIVALHRGFRPA